MDKLKRQIGYIPPEKKITPQTPVEKPATAQSIIEVGDALKITTWINTHPEFKWAAMCKKVGVSKGNFHRILQSENPNIKPEHIAQIKLILKEYGYE